MTTALRLIGPADVLGALRRRHTIRPVEVAPREEIGLAVMGTLAHHVCDHDGIPVYPVGGGQWRHDMNAIRHLAQGAPPGPARMSL